METSLLNLLKNTQFTAKEQMFKPSSNNNYDISISMGNGTRDEEFRIRKSDKNGSTIKMCRVDLLKYRCW